MDAGSRSDSINRIPSALPLTKRELDAIDSSFSILFRFLNCQRYCWRGATRKSPRCVELTSLIQIKTQSGHESASLCREHLLGARRRGDDVAQTKIVLSANVRVQRLPRRLGIRLRAGAGDVYADGARPTFLIDENRIKPPRGVETPPSIEKCNHAQACLRARAALAS